MARRIRLLMAATVLLYLGPLLAGLSGMGWSAIPVFVALMALWLVVMRPQQWPRVMAQWTPALAVTAMAQVAINAVIVVILFGIGRGIGGVSGFVPHIPPLVPVGLSFLAIPLSRLVWDPVKGAQMEAFLDSALDQINAVNLESAAIGDGGKDPLLVALLDLPNDADPALTADAISAAIQAPGGAVRLSQLEDELDYGTEPRPALREALILWATDPGRSVEDPVQGIPLTGFMAAGVDARLLELFARRALPLLEAQPGLWSSYPDATAIGMALDDSLPQTAQESLRALAAAVEAATPLEERMSGA